MGYTVAFETLDLLGTPSESGTPSGRGEKRFLYRLFMPISFIYKEKSKIRNSTQYLFRKVVYVSDL